MEGGEEFFNLIKIGVKWLIKNQLCIHFGPIFSLLHVT
jgi:hypothetical protein